MHLKHLEEKLILHKNAEQAVAMQKYMKNNFPFLGIRTPERRKLTKEFFAETGILKEPFQHELISKLWKKEEREYQYAACDYIISSLKKLVKDDMLFMERLITEKSWWDTVDTLAAHPVGRIAANHPETIEETVRSWAYGSHLWLIRTSIIYQLRYKQNTREDILYEFISQNAGSREFFIQKAIGWALREYSKTNPESVRSFISSSPLAPLSIREGSKYLK
ncbi:DNA alkylation repair protein [Bacillus infantis]|uniref:DNA alkylation repair protein n=1 Tax=Bacillus infantis TaxID=324767 RepID=UPI003CEC0B83